MSFFTAIFGDPRVTYETEAIKYEQRHSSRELHEVLCSGNYQKADEIIFKTRRGIDPTFGDKYGVTHLHFSCITGHRNFMEEFYRISQGTHDAKDIINELERVLEGQLETKEPNDPSYTKPRDITKILDRLESSQYKNITDAAEMIKVISKQPESVLQEEEIVERLDRRLKGIIHAKDYLGYTPLHYMVLQKECAANSGDNILTNYAVMEWLIQHGQDVNAKSKAGHTPLDLLTALLPIHFKQQELGKKKRLLVEHGAQKNKQVNIEEFQFPIFPKIEGLEWHEFPAPNAFSSLASSRSLPITEDTQDTHNNYNPDAYKVLSNPQLVQTSSSGIPTSCGSINLNKYQYPEDYSENPEDDATSESGFTHPTQVSGAAVTDDYVGISEDELHIPSQTPTESGVGSVPPSPTTDSGPAIFSSPAPGKPSYGSFVSPNTPFQKSSSDFEPNTPRAEGVLHSQNFFIAGKKRDSGLSQNSDGSNTTQSSYIAETPFREEDSFAQTGKPIRFH